MDRLLSELRTATDRPATHRPQYLTAEAYRLLLLFRYDCHPGCVCNTDIIDIVYLFDLILHIFDYLVQFRHCLFCLLVLEGVLCGLGLVGQHLFFEIVASIGAIGPI